MERTSCPRCGTPTPIEHDYCPSCRSVLPDRGDDSLRGRPPADAGRTSPADSPNNGTSGDDHPATEPGSGGAEPEDTEGDGSTPERRTSRRKHASGRIVDGIGPGGGSLERYSAVAFLIAGGLLTAEVPARIVGQLIGAPYPGGTLFVTGLWASVVGALGLYPRVAAGRPWLAFASGVVVALPIGAVWMALLATTAFPFPRFTAEGIVAVGTAVFVTWGFTVSGVTILVADVPSRAVGGLLLAFVAVIVGGPLLGIPLRGTGYLHWLLGGVVLSLPVLLLATGALVWTRSFRTERTATDSHP